MLKLQCSNEADHLPWNHDQSCSLLKGKETVSLFCLSFFTWGAFPGLATLRVWAQTNAFKVNPYPGRKDTGRVHPRNYLLVRIHSLPGRKLLLESWRPLHLPARALEAALAASEEALFLMLEQLSIWAAGNQRAVPSRALSGPECPPHGLNCWGCPLEVYSLLVLKYLAACF